MVERRSYPALVVVPQTDEYTEYKSYIGAAKPGLKEVIQRNMAIINATDFRSLNSHKIDKIKAIGNMLNHAWDRYRDKLEAGWDSKDAITDAFPFFESEGINHIPRDLLPERAEAGIKKLEYFFSDFLSQSKGDTVVISETHATTTPLLRTLKSEKKDARIGMFVFDTHLDTDPGPYGDVPRKSNTLRLLVDGDRRGNPPAVDRITVIGIPDRIEVDHRGSAWNVEQFGEKVNVITEDDLLGDDPHTMSFSKKASDLIVQAELKKMKDAGITNVMISFDLDVLKDSILGLTAMEYSAFHALMYLSTLELPDHKNDPAMIYSLLTNTGFAGEISGSIIDYPISLGGRGLSVAYSVHIIKAIRKFCGEAGIDFGVSYGQSTVLGDIVELSGPDYRDLTKKAALAIASAMTG